jgi:hypothetical protein
MDSTKRPSSVQQLIELANQIAPLPQDEQPDPRWHEAISFASSDTLVGVVSLLNTGRGETSRERKSLREAAIAEIERKNAKAIIDTLRSLDNATSALNKRMLWLTAVGVLLAVAQVLLALAPASWRLHG